MATGELGDAIRALETVEFPLLTDVEDTQLVSVLSGGHGREGLLPAGLFTPTLYPIGDDPEQAARAITRTWERGETIVDAIFEWNLGRDGRRIGSSVFYEMMLLAGYEHRASVAYSAARIVVDAEAEPATYLALWDDGRPYDDEADIERRFTHDTYAGALLVHGVEPYEPTDEERAKFAEQGADYDGDVAPVKLVKDVTETFNGSLTVVSGANRLDISNDGEAWNFEHSTVVPIIGNLVVARLPHKTQ